MKPRIVFLQYHVLAIYLIGGGGDTYMFKVFIKNMCSIDKKQSANSTALFCLIPTLFVSKVSFCKVSTLLTKIELGLLITHIYVCITFCIGCLGFFYLFANQLIFYVALENLNKILQGDKEHLQNFPAPDPD